MNLTARQTKLLLLLLGADRPATASELAAACGVSARTVHREIAELGPYLKRDRGVVLSGQAGLGLRVEADPERTAALLAELLASDKGDAPVPDREAAAVAALLAADEGLKLAALASELRVSIPAARACLESRRAWLASFGLALVLRRGFGVGLAGSESARRRAWCALLEAELGDAGRLALVKGRAPGPSAICDIALGAFDPAAFVRADEALSALPKGCLKPLALGDYLGLAVHVAVAAGRLAAGRSAEGATGDADSGEGRDREAAAAIARAAASAFSVEFGAGEVEDLALYLGGAKRELAPEDILDGAGVDVLRAVSVLTAKCQEAEGSPFASDSRLREGLSAHLPPALFRIGHGLPIRNPLLAEIRSRYGELFAPVAAAGRSAFPWLELPEDEIAYLVLHFAAARERALAPTRRLRAYVVCSAGVGSATMLASRLGKEFPEIEVAASLSWYDLSTVSRDSYDLLVSTVPLQLPEEDYVLVGPLLDEEGIRRVRSAVAARVKAASARPALRGGEPARDAAGAEGAAGPAISRRVGAVAAILEGIAVHPAGPGILGMDRLLAAVVEREACAGRVVDPDQALRDLSERSRDGGIRLGDGAVLFLHARSSGVSRPSLSLHALLGRPDEGLRGARLAVVLLAPDALSSELRAALNEVSVSLLDPATLDRLFHAERPVLVAHFSRYLEGFARGASGKESEHG